MSSLNNRITSYGFILTVFVIWLHAGESLISSIPGQIAVPGFFLLSGFLFFRGFDGKASCGEVFKRKLLSRAKTLLVPYLLWNLIYFLIYFAFGKAELSDLPEAVLHYGCNPVFWYLFQLMLITLLTPLMYVCIRTRAGAVIWLLAVFSAAVFYARISVHYCNEDALFYYSAGAWLSVRGADITEKKISRLIITAVLFAVTWFLRGILPVSCINISEIGWRLFGAVFLWGLLGYADTGKICRCPAVHISFFVYATHYLVIRAVWAVEGLMGWNSSAAAGIATYLFMPLICISAAYVLYIVMRRFMPRVLSALTGGR